jgi:site-specific DNA recombinase
VFFYLDDRERTLDSPLDKITLAVTAFADELKRVKDGQTVYDKVATKARHGYVVGCRVFGYDNLEVKGPTGKRSHIERAVNEAQATVVRRIFAMSAGGTGYSRIAKILNIEGAPAPKPKRGRSPGWSHTTIKSILDRRLYLGEAVWGRTKKRDKWGRKNVTRRPESEWIRAAVPPIITDAEWRAAHDRIDTTRQRMQAVGGAVGNRRARDVESDYLLSEFARCGECGSTLGVLSGGRARRRVYGCAHAHKTALCSNRLRLPIERVDDAVLQAIIDQVLTETVVQAVVEREMTRLSPTIVGSEMRELRASLLRVQREIDNLATAIARGGELESLIKKLSACEKERHDLRAAIKGRERVEGQRIERTRIEAAVRGRVENWRELLNRRKGHARQLLREMLAGPITFQPAGHIYRFRGEASFGALTGEAGTPFVVPVRGFEPRSRG